MESQGYLSNVQGVHGVYVVVAPFASVVPISDEQIVQEANPWAVFSHATAIAHHGLTNDIPQHLTANYIRSPRANRIPLGTTPDDWIELEMPLGSRPRQIGPVTVNWIRTKEAFDFGHCVSSSQGIPIYVTDVERTLLDALRAPAKCGGVQATLQAWKRALGSLNQKRLIQYTERFENAVLRQRVGFLLELAGVSDPSMDKWRKSLLRGGSVRFVAGAPYASSYSERWNLSLNVPAGLLEEFKSNS
jgi:predicted transcriptional regulator of viral defense system